MKSIDVILQILRDKGLKKAELARACGARRQIVEYRLNNKDMTVNTFVTMVNSVGFKVVVMPTITRTPKESYEVTQIEE